MLLRRRVGDSARLHQPKRDKRRSTLHQRRLHFAPLEERLLLSVVPPDAITIWKDDFESDAIAPPEVGQKSVHYFDNSSTYPTVSKIFPAVGGASDTVFKFDWCYNSHTPFDNVRVLLWGGSQLELQINPTQVSNALGGMTTIATTTDVWYRAEATIHPSGFYDLTIKQVSNGATIATRTNVPYNASPIGFTTIQLHENQDPIRVGTDVLFDNFSVAAAGFSADFEGGAYDTQPAGWTITNSGSNADFKVLKPSVPVGWSYSASDVNLGLATAVAPPNLGLGTKVANYLDNSSSSNPSTSIQFSPSSVGATSDIYFGFDWSYHNSNLAVDRTLVMFRGPNELWLQLTPTGVGDWNDAFTPIATTTDVWYHTLITAHPTGLYDITITKLSDGSHVGTRTSAPYTAASTPGFSTIQIQENLVDSSIGTNVSFDNFIVAKPLELVPGSPYDVFAAPADGNGFSSWINVKTEYGAYGDGLHDDTDAIQNALNAVGVAGGKTTVYLPAGTYKITRPLQMHSKDRVAVIGADPTTTIIKWAGIDGDIVADQFVNTVSGVAITGQAATTNLPGGSWIKPTGQATLVGASSGNPAPGVTGTAYQAASAIDITNAAPLFVYEGFDPASAPADGALINGVAGVTSAGFDPGSSWSSFGTSPANATYVASGLTFSTLPVTGGAMRVQSPGNTPRANASRPLNVGATGTIYGSYLARLGANSDEQDITGVSVASVNSYGNGSDAINDVSHFQVNIDMYQGSGTFGGGTINGDATPVGRFYNNASGTDVAASIDTTYLVLFKMENLSTPGTDILQTLTSWILTAAQYDNFIIGGLTEAELNAATEGTLSTNVLQRGSLTRTTDATFSATDFLLVNTAFTTNTIVDELRLSNTTLNEAVGFSAYTKPTKFRISADISPQSVDGLATNGRGAALGFYSATNSGYSSNNFTGLVLDKLGNLNLVHDVASGFFDQPGYYLGAAVPYTGGTFDSTKVYHLSYDVDTVTGAISNISLSGSTANYSSFNATTLFTNSATRYAGMYISSSTINANSTFDNFEVSNDRNPVGYPTNVPPAMLWLSGIWGCNFSRMTFDGAGHDVIGVAQMWNQAIDSRSANINRYSDLVFQDAAVGLLMGNSQTNFGSNDDGTIVVRCRFYRCSQAGFRTGASQAYDSSIWDSVFIDNTNGVDNLGLGKFDVFNSFFQNSTVSDIYQYHSVFDSTYMGNTSVGSYRFLTADGETVGYPILLQNNKILDTKNDTAILISQPAGNVVLLDNQIRSRSGATGPAVWMTSSFDANLASVENKFTIPNPILVEGYSGGSPRWFSQGDDNNAAITSSPPSIPGTPTNTGVHIEEVATPTRAAIVAAITNAVNWAAGHPSDRLVVHIPHGYYPIDQTIDVPANIPLQIIGDYGGGAALTWVGTGPVKGPVFRLLGPSKATIEDITIAGNNGGNTIGGSGIFIENPDQLSARVYVEGGMINEAIQYGLWVNDVANTTVETRRISMGMNSQGAYNGGSDDGTSRVVKVDGEGGNGTGYTALFESGTYHRGTGAAIEVTEGARFLDVAGDSETNASNLINLTDTDADTKVTIASTRFVEYGGHTIKLDGFAGKGTFVNVYSAPISLSTVLSGVSIAGETPTTEALFLGPDFVLQTPTNLWSDNHFNRTGPNNGTVSLVNAKYEGTKQLPSGQLVQGSWSARNLGDRLPTAANGVQPEVPPTPFGQFLTTMLDQLKTTKPMTLAPLDSGITDVRLINVTITNNTLIGIRVGGTDAPAVNLTAPNNNVIFAAPDAPASIPLSATAKDFDGTVTNLAFYQGATKIADGVLNAGVWTATWNLPAWEYGDYVITAEATDNENAVGSSPALNLSIVGNPTNQAADVGQTATFTVASQVGQTPLSSYQWQKFNSTNSIWENVPSGGAGPYYTTSAVTQTDNGAQYRVIVSKVGGTPVTSPAATLYVNYGADLWWKLDESGTASSASDTDGAGTNYTGTLVNFPTSPRWAAGIINNGLTFDGTDSFVRTASTTSTLKLTGASGEITLSTWAYINSTESDGALLFSKPYTSSISGAYNYQLGLNSGTTPTLYFKLTGGTTASPVTYTLTTNSGISRTAWHHIAVTVNNSNSSAILYVDGVAVASTATGTFPTTWSVTDSNQPLVVGSRHTTSNTSVTTLNGLMDNMRIYTHALSPLAIAEQARAPIASWKFNESSGTASDSSGNGYTGTLTTSPSAQFTTGYFNNGVSFNGTTGRVTAGASVAALKYKGADLTLSTWVYIDASESTAGTLISKPWSASPAAPNYLLGYSATAGANTALSLSLRGSTPTAAYSLTTATNVLAKGAWHHVAATVNGATKLVTLYLDGVSVASGTHAITAWTPTDSNLPLVLGSKYSTSTSSADGLNGKLDNVRVFDRALNATDIRFLAIDPPVTSTAIPAEGESQRKSIGAAARAHVDAALAALGFDAYSRAWDDEPLMTIQNRGARRPMGHRFY
jgi:hypothetical protein